MKAIEVLATIILAALFVGVFFFAGYGIGAFIYG